MSEQSIQRVDDIPLILHWLKAMGVREIIDSVWQPHGNWEHSSLGELAELFVCYVLHSLNHRLYQMEPWVAEHAKVLEVVTGRSVHTKDATDDRLGRMMKILGSDEDRSTEFQQKMGRNLIHAYSLPTEIARYDTTTFNVYHVSNEANDTLLRFGHSKNHRPDLLQFKQGLGTLDPAGIPLVTHTLSGNTADDPLYVPAWQELCAVIGHREFLFIADCKAAALDTRAVIDQGGGFYLFPLPKTGDSPALLRQWVLEPPVPPQEINLPEIVDEHGQPRPLGEGFVLERSMRVENESRHHWQERWLIVQSKSYAETQRKAFLKRVEKAIQELEHLKPKKDEDQAQFQARAEKILKNRKVEDCITLQVQERITHETKYLGRGRSGPNRPARVIEKRELHLAFQRNETLIAQELQLAGWRIYVTNTPEARLSLHDSVRYYRSEWLVERGFHRFKNGALPALPIYLQLPERIQGLMLLLTVALQALTLLEYVIRRALAKQGETLAGLVPGNPKMKTARPTAERILSQFDNLHLLVKETSRKVSGFLVEQPSPLQCRILELLG
ncbi:MAG: IS1634 family transposase, partial [Deltaproteobacteria bacterium]|nr:IS1634 family transposase [Deltaproteobacteria bacterium]